MKYLLVAQSLKKYTDLEEYCMPLGIAYINGAMRSCGFDVDAINMLFEDDPLEALRSRIMDKKIDVLMCGGLTSEYKVLKQIYSIAREANPNIIIVGGGGGFTSEPILFSEMTGVDYAVIGEGEVTNCELAYALDFDEDVSGIKGLVYCAEDGYHQNEAREYVKDLDSLPFPSYEGLSMDKYLDYQNVDGWYNYYAYYSDEPRLMPMLMARSCPFQCSFCFHPIGKGYRSRSLDNFFQELDVWVDKYHINGIALVDECFSIDKKRVIEFCERIEPYHLAWACQMRAETYTDDVLYAMKKSGCIGACFGIESMSETVLKNMNKHLSEKTIETALDLTYKYKLGCTGNLIFGSEAETFKTMSESLKWHRTHAKMHRNRPIRQFSYVQTYPGSIFYNNAFQRNVITSKKEYIETGNWDLNITSLSEEDYVAMGDVIRLCRRENYNKGKIIGIKIIDDKKVDFHFQCSYCGNENYYRNMNRSRFTEGQIKRLGCRHCNMLGDYVLDPERFLYDEYIAIPWFLSEIDIRIPTNYFSDNNWRRVGICGMNAFAKKVIKEIKNNGVIDVVYIYDYWKRNDFDYYGVPLITGEEELPTVDVVINCDLAYWKDMYEHLIKMGCTTQILYLETLLREWNEFEKQ